MFNRAGLSRKFLRFCVFTLTMQRHFADAMGEDATLMKRKRTQKMRRLTDMKFFVFGSVKPRQKIKKNFLLCEPNSFEFSPISLTSRLGGHATFDKVHHAEGQLPECGGHNTRSSPPHTHYQPPPPTHHTPHTLTVNYLCLAGQHGGQSPTPSLEL